MVPKRHLSNGNKEELIPYVNKKGIHHGIHLPYLPYLPYNSNWMWSKRHRSPEVILSETFRKAYFHPNWSKGTAAVRGNHAINSCRHYWEIRMSHRIFGTSMMFGIGTGDVRLTADGFFNTLGEDENGWGMSHKGLVWHNGISYKFTPRFVENVSTVIGLYFDGINGTLTYYKDGKCLGVAFRGLHKVGKPLYPYIISTAAKTEMVLCQTKRDFPDLKDLCRGEIMKHIKQKPDLDKLELPVVVVDYLSEVYDEPRPLTPVDNFDQYKV